MQVKSHFRVNAIGVGTCISNLQCIYCREWFPGGESHAQKRLDAKLADKAWVCAFEKPKTSPAAFMEPSTTGLSPYLKFGCLSPRVMYHELQKVYASSKGKYTKPPVSLVGQLYWREFFYAVSCLAYEV